MKIKLSLFIRLSALVLIVLSDLCVANEYITEFQRKIDIIHYSIKIDLIPETKTINGIVTITAKKKDIEQDTLELNFLNNMIVQSIKYSDEFLKFSHTNNRIKIDISEILSDTLIFSITYKGTPKRFGFNGFVFSEINGTPLVYTINQPEYASSWFPCDDDPEDKAFLDIEITNDSDFVSLSNGKLVEVKNSEKRKTFHWKTYYPISTYLVAVYSSKYVSFKEEYTSINGINFPLEYYVLPEHLEFARKDFSEHKDMLNTFELLFGEYPFSKEKYAVAEFLWNFGAMENQTITGIGYNFISGRNFARDILVHELAHHWWGNAVGPKSWKDIWLNEGFASYSEALYAEYRFGKSAVQSVMRSKFSENFQGALYNPSNLFSETIYDKGAWVLHMLRNELGDSMFFNSLRKYYETYKYGSASVEDFKLICENEYGKNLSKFFDDWVYNDRGIIKCNYSITQKDTSVIISIFQSDSEYNNFHFNLDIKVLYSDGTSEIIRQRVENPRTNIDYTTTKKIKEIIPDPDEKLLAVFFNSWEE